MDRGGLFQSSHHVFGDALWVRLAGTQAAARVSPPVEPPTHPACDAGHCACGKALCQARRATFASAARFWPNPMLGALSCDSHKRLPLGHAAVLSIICGGSRGANPSKHPTPTYQTCKGPTLVPVDLKSVCVCVCVCVCVSVCLRIRL